MRSHHHPLLRSAALAVLFAALFHGTGIGLNLLLFEVVAIAALLLTHRPEATSWLLLSVAGTLCTAVAVVWHGSQLAIAVNLLSGTVLLGTVLAPRLGAPHHAVLLALAQAGRAQRAWARALPGRLGLRPVLAPRVVAMAVATPFTLLLFSGLYASSNPFFEAHMLSFFTWVSGMDARLPLDLAFGAAIGAALLVAATPAGLLAWATRHSDRLPPMPGAADPERQRLLRTEAGIGIALLTALNLLLLLLNALDIQHVWFGFHFTGQYLRSFLHEGTWSLLASILLGAALVLYLFRGELNALPGARAIRWLSYLWLAQNIVLTISVAIRDHWYIQHYALAYKRIGVAFFLVVVLVFLVLILQKVRHRTSTHRLVRCTAATAYATALVMALFDWDTRIARYNMAHRGAAFVELDFLATLAPKALPHLRLSTLELRALDAHDRTVLGNDRFTRTLYMDPARFASAVHERAAAFVHAYPARSWRMWNSADAAAFAQLRDVVE